MSPLSCIQISLAEGCLILNSKVTRQMDYTTISEIAFNEIREAILSGKFRPGERINQKQLTEELGISIIPLREAFKQLQAEGFVSIIPHRGAYVNELSRQEIEDTYLIRIELEGLAARLASKRLTQKEVKKIQTLFARMEAAAKRNDYKSLFDLNRKFHFTIYQGCNRPLLLEMLNDLWDRSSRYRTMQTHNSTRVKEELGEHRHILQACRQDNKKDLPKTIRFNLKQSLRRSLNNMDF